jgi:hypothetical protein
MSVRGMALLGPFVWFSFGSFAKGEHSHIAKKIESYANRYNSFGSF